MIDPLKTIGIEKDKSFRPDPKTQQILINAMQEAKAWFEARSNDLQVNDSKRSDLLNRLVTTKVAILTALVAGFEPGGDPPTADFTSRQRRAGCEGAYAAHDVTALLRQP
jgi:hypothetical protein